MATEVDIWNIALTELKDAVVTDPDDNGKPANVCRSNFPAIRDAVLASHPWNESIRRAQLSVSGDNKPPFGLANAFAWPTEPYCLRIWQIPDLDNDDIPWKSENRFVLTDASGPLNVIYIARNEVVSSYSPLLVQAMGHYLAHRIAGSLGATRTLKEEQWNLYKEVLKEARGIDGQEGTPDDLYYSSYVDSRL